jgi:hypothetical protein
MDQSESLAHENIADTNEKEVVVTAAQERTDPLDLEGLQSHNELIEASHHSESGAQEYG